jgi:hypothetical protein
MSQRRLITCKKSMPRCRKVATPKAPARIAGSELAGRVTRGDSGTAQWNERSRDQRRARAA